MFVVGYFFLRSARWLDEPAPAIPSQDHVRLCHRRAAVAAVLAQPAGNNGVERRATGPHAFGRSPEPGQPGSDRSGQRDHQAGDARHARRGRQHPLGKGQLLPQSRGLGQPLGHARANRQVAAQLCQRVVLPGLEPFVQHFGRVRRLPRPLLLGDPGHQLPQGRDAIQQGRTATAFGYRLVYRPENRPRRRTRAVSPVISGRRRLQRFTPLGHATIGSSVANG